MSSVANMNNVKLASGQHQNNVELTTMNKVELGSINNVELAHLSNVTCWLANMNNVELSSIMNNVKLASDQYEQR